MSLLEIDGLARFSALNARKEGKGDVKVLTVDLKFNIDTSNEVLIHFHAQLRVMLFDKDGMPRFPIAGPLPWVYEFANQYMEVQPDAYRPLKLHGCRLKNFEFLALDGNKVRIGFSAQVRPTDGDFELMGKILAEKVGLKVRNDNLQLFQAPRAEPQRAAPAQLQLEDTPAAAAPVSGEPPASAPAASEPQPPADPAPAATAPIEEGDDVVPAVNAAGTPLGIRLSKSRHPVGSVYENAGITYDVTGQGDNTITLMARTPGAPAPAAAPKPPLELNDGLLAFMNTAGQFEAKKEEDDRDFDTGFAMACRNANLPREFIEENLVELQAAFADGFEATAAPDAQ